MSDFRFPYDIAVTLEPWKSQLGDEFGAVVAHLADRDRALEDYLTAAADGHTHDGTGLDSTITHPSDDDAALASGDRSLAMGEQAEATADQAVAVGYRAAASGTDASCFGNGAGADGTGSLAAGHAATAEGARAVAIGDNAFASHDDAVALGEGVATTNSEQVNIGTKRAFLGAPDTAPADADLANAQLSFSLDQPANTLLIKVKYDNGTVKTGSVALV